MTYVSHSLMETMWRRVGAKSADQIPTMQKRHQKTQKALSKFVYRHLLEIREDASGVGLYVFHVIVEAFCSRVPKPKAVRRPTIDRAWGLPAAELDLEACAVEPHASQYLEEALADMDDVVLTDEEKALCTRVIQAAILCLHQACQNRT